MRKKGQSLPISIPKILLSFAIGVGAAVLFLVSKKISSPYSQNLSEPSLTEVVLSAIPQIQERWSEGDMESHFATAKWACRSLAANEHISRGFLKCQPAYLECFARGEAGLDPTFKVTLQKKEYAVKLRELSPGRYGQWLSKSDLLDENLPVSGLLVQLEVKDLGVWPVILEDTCRDQFLPQRFYSYGARPEKGENPLEMMWDNFGRNIFVDKYLVSRMDWALWKKMPAPNDPSLPITGVTINEQEAYCASRGGLRLDALLWDAATMSPVDLKRDRPQFITKPWLPWSRDRRETFFDLALKDPDWRPTLSDCKKAYVKECQGFPYAPYEMDNISWMGVSHVLGGTPEIMRNSVEGELVYKASSKLESVRSLAHQLGVRRAQGAESAFRCYREIFP